MAAAATSSAAPLPSIYDVSPPYGKVTDTDHGPWVVICAWVMMCFFTLAVLTRLLTRAIPVFVAGIDDALSGLSMLFGIAQTVTIYVSARHGLGQPQHLLSANSFATYAKTYYVANLLYLFAVWFAKASIVCLIIRLSPSRETHRLCYGLLGIISIWVVVELFVFAFQSPLPHPWNYEKGYNVSISAMYYTEAAFDILTDISVMVLPAWVIWHVQIPIQKRLAIIGVFSSRIAVVICSACRMGFLNEYLHTNDKSWAAVTPQTWLQVIQCLSILTACIPCLKPFLESLESGFINISLKQHGGTTYGSGRHAYGSGGKSKKTTVNDSYAMNSFTSQNRDIKPDPSIDVNPIQAQIDGGHFLDTSKSRHQSRKDSLPESERVLTSNSSGDDNAERFDFGLLPNKSGEGIKVTREIEIRDAAHDSMDMSHGPSGRKW